VSTALANVVVEVREVSKSYRRGPEEVHALREVSFDLRPGEVVTLVGPSGSGKSTLLNVLCGWEHPDAGRISWPRAERDVAPEQRVWAELAILPQTLGLIEELSIRENVELPMRLSGRRYEEGAARIDALLERFGLEALADREPEEVSLGEQQRSALARALLLQPQLLLADEPTGHQDEGWGRRVLATLRDAARAGTCCLIATHNREAMRFADRVLGIRDGVVRPLRLDPEDATEPDVVE
jgi:putative ABC transport system ATP-binding protein